LVGPFYLPRLVLLLLMLSGRSLIVLLLSLSRLLVIFGVINNSVLLTLHGFMSVVGFSLISVVLAVWLLSSMVRRLRSLAIRVNLHIVRASMRISPRINPS
jgi:hypothetical protein